MDGDSYENSFCELRRLAHNVDKGVSEVKSRIDQMNEVGFEHRSDSDETAAILFLQRSHKSIRDISSNVKSIQTDFKMRSSTLNCVSALFEYALESFKRRLEEVESFTEQYGYKRPDFTASDKVQSSTNTGECVSTEDSNSEGGNDISNVTETIDLNPIENGDMEVINSEKTWSIDCGTPKLENIGLSEHTMFKLKSGYYDNYGKEIPSSIRKQTFNESKNEHLSFDSVQKTKNDNEVSTPRLESYGISEHTMKYFNHEMRSDRDNNMTIPKDYNSDFPETPTFNEVPEHNLKSVNMSMGDTEKMKNEDLDCFDLPPTPKLGALSEHTLMFFKSSTVDKENVYMDSTPVVSSLDSNNRFESDTPDLKSSKKRDISPSDVFSTPKLNSYGLSQYTLNFLNNKEEKTDNNYLDFE